MSYKRILKYLKRPFSIFNSLMEFELFNWMPDDTYLKLAYRARIGKNLDLNNPKTFNEKLQWLKLHDRNPLYHKMVDKYEVKQYVSDRIGQEYIIPTLGVWCSVEDIPFELLPDQFVLKCTHDSGSVIICRDKKQFNIEAAKKNLSHHMKKNLYWFGREWPYKGLSPRIIAEPYLEDNETKELRDYKFFCFNGQPKCFKVDFDRFTNHRANYFDLQGNLLGISEIVCPADPDKRINMPSKLKTMENLAGFLSSGIPFLRIDFYEVNGSVFLGELTFFPASGFGPFEFEDNDELLGSWLQLPERGVK